MACSEEFIDFVCGQLSGTGEIVPRKMFGDWLIYVDGRPAVLCCDEICYVKKLPELADMMSGAECGIPYPGAKEHYILDIEHENEAKLIVRRLISGMTATA